MDLLKNQLARLQQHLSSLNASQKMLAATLVAIMVMTLFWWGHYAGTAEMEPVLNQDFSAEDIARVTADLSSRGIAYSVVGAHVLVPSDRKYEVLASLSFAGLLPHDTTTGIDEMINKLSTPFDSSGRQDDLRNKTKEMTLALVLRNFPRVRNAVVVIDPTTRRGIDNSILPTASVNLELKPGSQADKKLVNAAADLVSGAVANLPRNRVSVIVDGATWKMHDADDGGDGSAGGETYLEREREGERYYAEHIRDYLSFIDGLAVSVAVKPNGKSERGETMEYDPKKSASLVSQNETNTDETSTPGAAAAKEPGVVPNARMSIDAPASAGSTDAATTSRDTNKTTYTVSTAQTRLEWVAHDTMQVVSATVRVPRSYFIRMLKQAQSDKEPSDAMVDQVIDRESANIRKEVKNCVGLTSDDSVMVSTYTDVLPAGAGATPAAASAFSLAVGNHAKEIVLGALAVVSLFMVSMMVKKGGVSTTLVEAPQTVTPGVTAATAAKAAKTAAPIRTAEELEEVGEGGSALDGIELDEEAVRSKQMLDQVTSMVKENPDGAANLVKRWLNRS